MVAQKRGAIVNTASVAGIRGSVGLSAYNAAKHGVVGLTRNAALEFAPAGVRVNCVCPGIIDTPLVARAFGHTEEIREAMHRFHPLGRMGKPIEIAKCRAVPRVRRRIIRDGPRAGGRRRRLRRQSATRGASPTTSERRRSGPRTRLSDLCSPKSDRRRSVSASRRKVSPTFNPSLAAASAISSCDGRASRQSKNQILFIEYRLFRDAGAFFQSKPESIRIDEIWTPHGWEPTRLFSGAWFQGAAISIRAMVSTRVPWMQLCVANRRFPTENQQFGHTLSREVRNAVERSVPVKPRRDAAQG